MSKLSGTIAFIGGVLLIIMAITGVLIKNEQRLAHMPLLEKVEEVEEVAENDHGHGHEIPDWLRFTMYGTLILSGAFTVIHVSRFGITNSTSFLSTAAFVGGITLVFLGFVGTLIINDLKIIEHENQLSEAVVEVELTEQAGSHEDHGHDSGIPDGLRYMMMTTLFISGAVAVYHVSKYGLD